MESLDETTRICKVINKKGVHARAAAQIVSKSSKFNCKMTVSHQTKTADSLSLIKLLTLDAPQGSILKLKASGHEAERAIEAIAHLIENGFGELE